MDYTSENILTKRELINKIHEYNNDQFIISIDRQKNLDTLIKYDIDKDDIYNYINLLTEKNYKKYINRVSPNCNRDNMIQVEINNERLTLFRGNDEDEVEEFNLIIGGNE